MENVTISGTLFFYTIWLYALYRNRHFLLSANNLKSPKYLELAICTIILSTFAFVSYDFYQYLELYNNCLKSHSSDYFEDFFIWTILNLYPNYFFWRFVIWGTAIFLYIKTIKILKCNRSSASLLFIIISLLGVFYYPRNILGYCVLYYGVVVYLSSFNYNRKINIINVISGSIFVLLSIFLHKSMILYAILILISSLHFNKYTIISLIALFPFFYGIINVLSVQFINIPFIAELTQGRGETYILESHNDANILGNLLLLIKRVPILLLLYISVKNIYFKYYYIEPKYEIFLKYSFLLIYISLLFYEQSLSRFLAPRFFDAALLPFTIFLSVFLFKIKRSRFIQNCLYLLVFTNVYIMVVQFYQFFK